MFSYEPSASKKILIERANILATLRSFFKRKNILEVETPLLCRRTVTDPFIESLKVDVSIDSPFYLQTSPEYAMKRLLAAGMGSIYQICKAFRKNENGHFHNPEFTMLEWYRVDFNYHQLMEEVDELLGYILNTPRAEKMSYCELFQKGLGFDPLTANNQTLLNCASFHQLKVENIDIEDRDTWLQLLMSHLIEPKLGWEKPVFVYDFPISQAALAKVKNDYACRFEVYVNGLELANGFDELQDATLQRERFLKNNEERKRSNKDLLEIDEKLLNALEKGLPNCSGVAMGIDRLVMLALKQTHIQEVISFDFSKV